jgi:two-component system chemotaxis response regulator CheB
MTAVTAVRERVDAVVIGASAGGIDGLSVILPALPPTLSVAVLVVLHLQRDYPSMLADIYRPHCAVLVKEAEDKEPVRRGTVYFAPPNYHLLVDVGPRLALSVDEPVHFSRPSVDVLFESAADIYAQRLLGVVLTGANQDGATGLHAIHKAGGLTAVQAPTSTYESHMAKCALERGPVDFVLPLQQLAELLGSLRQ